MLKDIYPARRGQGKPGHKHKWEIGYLKTETEARHVTATNEGSMKVAGNHQIRRKEKYSLGDPWGE